MHMADLIKIVPERVKEEAGKVRNRQEKTEQEF